VGPGGSGKTRLAIEAAAGLVDDATPQVGGAAPQGGAYAHGVFFVSLAPVQSSESIVPTIAQAIGFSFYKEGGPEEQLLAYLAQKRMLLILDNLEHLLALSDGSEQNGAGLVVCIVEGAPDVKVLATSRAALRVQHEEPYWVAGMAYPECDSGEAPEIAPENALAYSAIGLFRQCARRATRDFELRPNNVRDVIRICRLVAGMPLGIVLASSWAPVLAPGEIAAQLEGGLDLLETDLRDVPERQRSMRAVLDYSWDLLSVRQREVMAPLSVFRGGFTRRAAQQVAGASAIDLRSLIRRSLVQPVRTRSTAPAADRRFELHELTRQYAEERLDESPARHTEVRDRHAAYYSAALHQWGEDFKGSRQRNARAEMDVDIDNVRVAWDWAVKQGHIDQLAQAAIGLAHYHLWWSLSYDELGAALRSAVERLKALGALAPGVSAKTLMAMAWLIAMQAASTAATSRFDAANDLLEEGLQLLSRPEAASVDTREIEAFLSIELGQLRFMAERGDPRPPLERGLALARSIGDRYWLSRALRLFGHALSEWGSIEEAKRRLREAVALSQSLGDAQQLAEGTAALAWAHVVEEQFEEAEQMALQSVAAFRDLGDERGYAAVGLGCLSAARYWAGQYAEARGPKEEGLGILEGLGARRGFSSWDLANINMHQGHYESARALAEMAMGAAREVSDPFLISLAAWPLGRLALREGAYAEARILVLESIAALEGRTEPVAQASQAVHSCLLAHAELGLGDLEGARGHIVEGLRSARKPLAFGVRFTALPAAALLLLHEGKTERAAEIYALACTFGHVANSQWYADVVGRPIAEAAATLPPEVVVAAKERGRTRDVQATLKELIEEWEDWWLVTSALAVLG
jgi:predicted ATPase